MDVDIDFKVKTQKIFLEDGEEIKDKRAIVREDNGFVLGIVGEDYKVVPHRAVVDAFDKIPSIKRKSVDVCKGGGILFGHYDLRDNGSIKKIDVKVGDAVSFGLRIFNSYVQSVRRSVHLHGTQLEPLK